MHLVVLARNSFPAAFDAVACCMQNCSSIHRIYKKIDLRQGFAWWHPCLQVVYGRHYACFFVELCRRFACYCEGVELAARVFNVTRKDGLSSWRVILYVAAGMLSGKSGETMYKIWTEK